MKKFFIILAIFTFIVAGLFYADSQSEDGLIEDIRYIILPNPMTNNLYDEGECTYYVFDLVKNDLNMIENSWGDAEHWAERAEADVNQSPEAGALLQTSSGEIGHVAYVTDVNNDGSIEISEMNFYEQYEITERTIDSEDISDYNFIHPKENPRPKDTLE